MARCLRSGSQCRGGCCPPSLGRCNWRKPRRSVSISCSSAYLLPLGQFERLEHCLHVVQRASERLDDVVDLFDGLLNGHGSRGCGSRGGGRGISLGSRIGGGGVSDDSRIGGGGSSCAPGMGSETALDRARPLLQAVRAVPGRRRRGPRRPPPLRPRPPRRPRRADCGASGCAGASLVGSDSWSGAILTPRCLERLQMQWELWELWGLR